MARPIAVDNPIFDQARSVLARFGYRALGRQGPREDWAEMWDLLREDFARPSRPPPPAFEALSPAAQEAAMRYMGIRLEADRLLERCIETHGELQQDGIRSAAVERYANVRESYEAMIERFGEARRELDELLSQR